jgi:hypothetical protein
VRSGELTAPRFVERRPKQRQVLPQSHLLFAPLFHGKGGRVRRRRRAQRTHQLGEPVVLPTGSGGVGRRWRIGLCRGRRRRRLQLLRNLVEDRPQVPQESARALRRLIVFVSVSIVVLIGVVGISGSGGGGGGAGAGGVGRPM